MANISSAVQAPSQPLGDEKESEINQETTLADDPGDRSENGDGLTSVQEDDEEDLREYGKGDDEIQVLKSLGATVRNQDDLEEDIGRQADFLLREQADERDQRRVAKCLNQKEKLEAQVRKLQKQLEEPSGSSTSQRLRSEIEHLQPQIDALDQDILQIHARMEERQREHEESARPSRNTRNRRLPGETNREFLIRTGKITPFSRIGQSLMKQSSDLRGVMLDAEDNAADEDEIEEEGEILAENSRPEPISHRILKGPGYKPAESSEPDSSTDSTSFSKQKKKRLQKGSKLKHVDSRRSSSVSNDVSQDEYAPKNEAELYAEPSDSESDGFKVVTQGNDGQKSTAKKRQKRAKKHVDDESADEAEDMAGVDDGNEQLFQNRLRRWAEGRAEARSKAQAKNTEQTILDNDADESLQTSSQQIKDVTADESYLPHPTIKDTILEGGLRIPGDIYPSLFDYQKTGVQWLWELYGQAVGGIVADEMGLGKTIQIIAFLAGLHYSKQLRQPIIVVAPATVMKQWVNEFHRWWPPLRVSILHSSGSGMLNVSREEKMENKIQRGTLDQDKSKGGAYRKTAKKIVDRVVKEGHVLVTTYSGLQSYAELLIPVNWGYAVLDEGHKIKNPNAAITIYCKELRTANRMILSGTPMQNDLTELWSLFDFVFPMRLGNLVNFRSQFEFPIKQGGYANASNLQVETALKCAETLKDAISPYLLQRLKADVASDLPEKAEEVLFCRLTRIQREMYERFLKSEEVNSIMTGKRQALYGIDILRKICNHPDLPDRKVLSTKPGYNYGSGNKCGKMQVVKALLQIWKDEGHKALLFTQSQMVLDILEKFIKSIDGLNSCRMDGTTSIKDRQALVDEFNNNPDIHVFLLTTRVGGLGVNLTGANRVIIYDPDWNPSTDIQARERAWRLGQTKTVQIYRLMTAGTIEEKIYHRQIFKQHLTNKILRDPKQQQTFQLKDLHDLFSLGDVNADQTETSGMFKGSEVKVPKDSNQQSLPSPPEEVEEDKKINKVYGIARRENYRTGEEEGTSSAAESPAKDPSSTVEDGPNNPNSQRSNSRLLSTIFARSGVHSRLEHDAIVSGSSSRSSATSAGPEFIAREAKKVAAEAARELQRAGEAARGMEPGTVTWTGTFGTGGAPEQPLPRGQPNARGGRGGTSAPESSSVLGHLSARQQQQPRGREFLALIRNFLIQHGGSVHTQMLIDHFNRYCGTPERTAEFKEMLKTIAVLERPGDAADVTSRGRLRTAAQRQAWRLRQSRHGRARWVLKAEYGGQG